MIRRPLAPAVVIASLAATFSARGDGFDAIEGKALAASLKTADAKAVDRLTLDEMGALPDLFKVSPAGRSWL